jgi:AbrB family looped-hinge helix DNA binding protein
MPELATVTMSTKGQIVIPRALREQLGWGEGTRLELESHAGRIVLRPARRFPETRVDDLLGLLPYTGLPKSIEEMQQAIAKGASLAASKGR